MTKEVKANYIIFRQKDGCCGNKRNVRSGEKNPVWTGLTIKEKGHE
jgi:hypothetical protein